MTADLSANVVRLQKDFVSRQERLAAGNWIASFTVANRVKRTDQVGDLWNVKHAGPELSNQASERLESCKAQAGLLVRQ